MNSDMIVSHRMQRRFATGLAAAALTAGLGFACTGGQAFASDASANDVAVAPAAGQSTQKMPGNVKTAGKALAWTQAGKDGTPCTLTLQCIDGKLVPGLKAEGPNGSVGSTAKKVSGSTAGKYTVKRAHRKHKRSRTVYTTATGKRYHSTKHCRGLNRARHIYRQSLKSAKAAGLSKCKLCW